MLGVQTGKEIEYNQCQEAVKRLTDYLSHELVGEEEQMILQHLTACKGCFEKFKFEETLLRTIRLRLHDVEPPASLRSRILRIIDHQTELEVPAIT